MTSIGKQLVWPLKRNGMMKMLNGGKKKTRKRRRDRTLQATLPVMIMIRSRGARKNRKRRRERTMQTTPPVGIRSNGGRKKRKWRRERAMQSTPPIMSRKRRREMGTGSIAMESGIATAARQGRRSSRG